jgi:hypothetical protein
MAGHECYHCKQWVEPGDPHNCWTTTEAALTADLSEDLREAWERLRETAIAFGEQRTYASLNSIMFSRTACYCFVRPKRKYLEVCFFLGRTVKAPQITRAMPASRVKVAHLVRVRHRDEVEAPLTGWMREAYETSDALSARARTKLAATKSAKARRPRKKDSPAKAKPATDESPGRRRSRSPAPARSRQR